MSTEPSDLIAATPPAASDVWAEQARIARQLAGWSLVSIFGGSAAALAGQVRGNPAVRAFGGQNAAWGAIDLAIAGFGELSRRARVAKVEDPNVPAVQDDERRSLRRILLVNAGLDACYVGAGLGGLAWSLRGTQRPRPAVAGHAAAVVVQGGFLLAFDALHVRRLR